MRCSASVEQCGESAHGHVTAHACVRFGGDLDEQRSRRPGARLSSALSTAVATAGKPPCTSTCIDSTFDRPPATAHSLLLACLLACFSLHQTTSIRPPPLLPLLSAMSGAQKSAINRMKAAQQANNKQT